MTPGTCLTLNTQNQILYNDFLPFSACVLNQNIAQKRTLPSEYYKSVKLYRYTLEM